MDGERDYCQVVVARGGEGRGDVPPQDMHPSPTTRGTRPRSLSLTYMLPHTLSIYIIYVYIYM
jgi:hypothetical protein